MCNGGARGAAGGQRRDERFYDRNRGGTFPIAAAGLFLQRVDTALQAVEIGEHEFGLHDFGVADGVDAAFDVGHVAVLETAQDVDDGVGFADVG